MTDLTQWENEQRAVLADLQRKAAAVQAALARLSAKASSGGGDVAVTVDANGHLQHIQLAPQALRLGETRLAQLLLDTIQQAVEAAARQAREVARPLTDDPRVVEATTAIRAVIDNPQPEPQPQRAMTDAEMDNYYMNRKSWLT